VSVLALASLVTVVGACGDDDDGDGTEIVEGDALPVDPEVAPFCEAYGALLVNPLADVGSFATPAELQVATDAARLVVEQLRVTAPAEVAEAAEAIAGDYTAVFGVLERYGYDLARYEAEATPDDRRVVDTFGQAPEGPGVSNPQGDLERYVAAECAPGVTLPPDLTGTTSP
jgi:hypothetical protein